METEIFKDDISGAAEILSRGGLVAVPTETVYGLAANGLDASAVAEVYEVKGRPAIKPLSLMVPGKDAIGNYTVAPPSQAYALAEKFWPGPLTIVLNATDNIPSIVLAGGTTVGLRCPDHPLTLKLLNSVDFPLAAPSANPSGYESPKSAAKVEEYFNGAINGIIDGGECSFGFESTIISMSSAPFRILRQGALPEETLVQTLVDGMHIIGITGGSGTGKSKVLEILRSKGFEIIDCDLLYHDMLEADEDMIKAISNICPECNTDGTVNRKILAGYVFADPKRLSDLNAVTHSRIIVNVNKKLRSCAMNGTEFVAIEAAELISSGLSELCDAVVAVTSDRENRIKRICERDGIEIDAAVSRIDAQKPDEYYFGLSDYCIENNGSITELEAEITTMLKEI